MILRPHKRIIVYQDYIKKLLYYEHMLWRQEYWHRLQFRWLVYQSFE